VDLRSSRIPRTLLDHHEPPANGRNVVVRTGRGARLEFSLKDQPGGARAESWFGSDVNGHHLVAAAVEKLCSGG